MENKNLQKLLTEYLEHLEIEKNRSQRTLENYNHYLKRFLDWAKVNNPEDITEELVRKYRLYLNRLSGNCRGRQTPSNLPLRKGENYGNEGDLKKVTQNYHIIALRGFLKYLAKRDIKSLPAEKVELGQQEKRQVEFLDKEELERLLNAPALYVSNTSYEEKPKKQETKEQRNKETENLIILRDKAILELLFSAGLRVSELVSLNRDDINFDRGEFSVRGKGRKLRVAFLSDDAKKTLQEYFKKRKDIEDALFINLSCVETLHCNVSTREEKSKRLTSRSIQRIVQKYAKIAGIMKKVTPHTIRHSFATDLLFNGADIRSVQSMLGHSNIATTQIYTHVTDIQLKNVHSKFHGKK